MSVITGDDSDNEVAQPETDTGDRCVRRESGAWQHVFLNHSNRCQCGDKDLNAYRKMVLQ